jgi:two-component system nitrate/nitrite sensor histidine kinase NarX
MLAKSKVRSLSTAVPDTPASTFLADLTAGVSDGDDLQSLLQRFLAPLVRLAGAQGGTVRVLHDDDDRLHLVGTLGPSAGMCGAGEAVNRHCGFCGAATDGAALVWARDLSACRLGAGSLPAEAAGAQRLLAVPLQHHGRVLGVYTLFFDERTELSNDVRGLLKTVGELLGLALDHARLEAQNLSATLQSERLMLAADVHDGIAQSLTFVKMRLPLLQDAMRTGDLVRAQRYLDEVDSAAGQAQASLRNILTQMRAPMDPAGLMHALEASAQTFRRSCDAQLALDNRLPELKLSPEQETQVYHLVQEALTNIARHAAAQHAWLRIDASAPGWVEVLVDDDGAGLAPAAGGGSHYGLAIMQDRARRIGGTLSVGARPGGGTRVRLLFPCRAPQPDRAAALEARA